ncbi:threonine-phosphate decarboxylase CobD [Anabaena sp. FACHB-709]|uniref:threonine-phosphate decarboxylase n=2 Tax=Nostocaceae TaxID=1162 RepID=A0A1Z4KL00_ANAVA|nr:MULTISPECIES: threonine-phosphate decarboxylase CobD [Nostocaceae]BAY69563.1 histidinol-phosphate aminotransferase [Trichormus variabilis NIES-23]HBW31745.1 threonine-phosphate decarboxylase [Nostoc sp. UBA8866]MBD2170972.1 threonine-phosphate decarboxylase [Anabaena cylindrica FACHB-318]MBD2262754.1 threonine-phosphate decarboxylase [Anabaena sp. FACHB-709]MBD2272449.1 threonine-phosphate decarboxylase [Nostoc sp. PCC 7120 = FACHB-418]
MRQPNHGGNLAWAAALAGCPADAIVDFSASISPLGPPQNAIAAIQSQISNLRHYPDPDYRELRLALSHFHQLPLEWILPGNGSAELLTLAGRELAQLAATILITPAFGDYYRTLRAYHAKVLEFPLVSAESRILGTECHLTQLHTQHSGLITNYALLLNNPHNPTGKLFTREAILPLLEQFALVVVDEAFMDFVPPDEEQSLIPVVAEYPNLVILRSLTKFYSLPGLRLGYAIAHPDRLQKWQLWRDPWPVNTLAAAAAIAALEDREFQAQTWQWLPPAREELFQGLTAIPGLIPQASAANFLLVETQQSSLDLQQKLLQQHQILIRDCLSFKELGDRFFRVAVRSHTDNQRLTKALSAIVQNSFDH